MYAKRLVVVFGVVLLTAGLAQAQNVGGPEDRFFRVQFEAAEGRGGVRVTGYVYNRHIYSAVNVRLRLQALDASGQVVGERFAYVLGDVPAEGRAFFAVPVQAQGATYRVSVHSFEFIARSGP